MRLGSMKDGPSGRPELGDSGSPDANTARPGAAEWGMPNGGIAAGGGFLDLSSEYGQREEARINYLRRRPQGGLRRTTIPSKKTKSARPRSIPFLAPQPPNPQPRERAAPHS